MPELTRFKEVRVLLADTRAEIRGTLRTALALAGFERVSHTGSFDTIISAFGEDLGPDVLICDMGMRSGEACRMVRDIRHAAIGRNPFACIIGVTWNPADTDVRRIVDSGVDVLIAAPLSPRQVLDRINALVVRRASFVVTTDYVGPDRRGASREPSLIPLLNVPNTLRSKVRGEWNFSTMQREIQRAAADVKATRTERQGEAISQIATLLADAPEPSELNLQAIRLHKILRELEARATEPEFRHTADLCRFCRRIVEKVRTSGAPPSEKELQFLHQLGEAIGRMVQRRSAERANG